MTLRARLASERILVAPGVYDGLTALLAQEAGFEALYLSGAAVSYTKLGRPDIGLSSVTEMAETMALVRDRVELPVIIDADTGFGNALNAQRTMRLYERAGANALQLEDQSFPKRCGHLSDKALIPTTEMAGKIEAMADARTSDETLIIARTDAVAVEGFEAAMERAERYVEAGADILFVEAPRSGGELQAVAQRFSGRIPLLANMVEGGATPIRAAADLEALGFSVAIFPGGIVRAVARAAEDYYVSLKQHGSNAPFADRMFDFAGLNDRLGTDAILTLGRKYESGAK
jgi:2-methylisocitrate lyase-like PEP mutase family enzyme